MTDMFSVHHTTKGQPFQPKNIQIVGETRLIRVYIKPDGAKDNMPSFLFIHQLPDCTGGVTIASQISAQMFRPFYEELKKIYEPEGQ